ncbi:ribosomal protein S5 domain 2-like protein [Epithele typhae]|uniref:ribosomal protein S5 domain 2-like protein n=1 Tax=Epithele typhae TaxID=378194 RepID=UPI0020078198|nr:ribosomal protein S5 domain 2-like protein [Epithele typhae]KAH9929495.1 ribosomal protein S5 domain 2-like protein [Epithele typhae]
MPATSSVSRTVTYKDFVKPKPNPSSPLFFTGRSAYMEVFNSLQATTKTTRNIMQQLELVPLPAFAQQNLPPLEAFWKDKTAVEKDLNVKLSTTRYARIISALDELNNYRRIAQAAGHGELVQMLERLMSAWERPSKAAILAQRQKKPVQMDEHGRSYTIGRRKESTARVWMIPTQAAREAALAPSPSITPSASAASPDAPLQSDADALADVLAAAPAVPIPGFETGPLSQAPAAPVEVPVTNILVNNVPFAEFFPNASDRERIVRPFRVTGLFGAFNVFAIVRGGGTTGQSGAVTLGIAKAIAAHVPDVEPLLRKAKLLKRDPRMVERKKPGRAKARKGYTWVKR